MVSLTLGLLTNDGYLAESSNVVIEPGERQIGTGYRSLDIVTEKGRFGDFFLTALRHPIQPSTLFSSLRLFRRAFVTESRSSPV